MKVSKEKLIRWAVNLKSPDVELEIDFSGGGTSSLGRSVMGYSLSIDVGEEFADEEKPGLDELKEEKKCNRCGTALDNKGFCTDETCPFSDHKQSCPAGWSGHPKRPSWRPLEPCNCR